MAGGRKRAWAPLLFCGRRGCDGDSGKARKKRMLFVLGRLKYDIMGTGRNSRIPFPHIADGRGDPPGREFAVLKCTIYFSLWYSYNG